MQSALQWKPRGKRLHGRLRKRWIDVVKDDLRKVGVDKWKEMVPNRDELHVFGKDS